MGKPAVGIFGLTGCAGDQLVILNCEDRLLDLVSLVDIRDFLMASSENDAECSLDVALVEGAVLSNRDAEKLRTIRKRARILVALGTCAVWGGVAAMDRGADRRKLLEEVYGETGLNYDSLPAQALHEIVKVDLNITGCPIEKDQFLTAIANLLNGDVPVYPSYPVCTECRMLENNCLLIEHGEVCCGPITAAGCNARCPEMRVPCVGCRGPAADANPSSFLGMFEEKGIDPRVIATRLRTFAPEGVAQ
ncbi:MAG TPA: NADH:ubiquinone oxidoreductase [Verrucomicrobiae bacterium]|nr:NADH:ubiquinone oxidoreductase [Verrucomicrobiae bacterium]